MELSESGAADGVIARPNRCALRPVRADRAFEVDLP
jgi:hypothetical protein